MSTMQAYDRRLHGSRPRRHGRGRARRRARVARGGARGRRRRSVPVQHAAVVGRAACRVSGRHAAARSIARGPGEGRQWRRGIGRHRRVGRGRGLRLAEAAGRALHPAAVCRSRHLDAGTAASAGHSSGMEGPRRGRDVAGAAPATGKAFRNAAARLPRARADHARWRLRRGRSRAERPKHHLRDQSGRSRRRRLRRQRRAVPPIHRPASRSA